MNFCLTVLHEVHCKLNLASYSSDLADVFHSNRPGSLHLEDVPEDECDGAMGDLKKSVAGTQRKHNYITRTRSIALGVDRIDDYSKVEITTPP